MELEKVWYICDPSKAKGCAKRNCKHNNRISAEYRKCERTSHEEWAALDENKNPVLYDVSAEERLKSKEMQSVASSFKHTVEIALNVAISAITALLTMKLAGVF